MNLVHLQAVPLELYLVYINMLPQNGVTFN